MVHFCTFVLPLTQFLVLVSAFTSLNTKMVSRKNLRPTHWSPLCKLNHFGGYDCINVVETVGQSFCLWFVVTWLFRPAFFFESIVCIPDREIRRFLDFCQSRASNWSSRLDHCIGPFFSESIHHKSLPEEILRLLFLMIASIHYRSLDILQYTYHFQEWINTYKMHAK